VAITARGYMIGDGNIYIDDREPLAHGYAMH